MLRLVSNRNSGHMTYFLPACAESKFQNLDKSAFSCDSKADDSCRVPKVIYQHLCSVYRIGF